MVTISQICSTEKELEEYFKVIKLLEDKKGELQLLYEQKSKVEANINNSNITLKSDIQGISYESPNVQRSNAIVSIQERALEKAFELLEKQLEDIQAEIIYIEKDIMKLERKVYVMDRAINQLKEKDRRLLSLVYVKGKHNKKSYEEIGELLNMHKTTAIRQKENLVKEITSWRAWRGDI